jgi:hypothetical protein
MGSIIGLAVLILDIWAIINVVQAKGDLLKKVLWILLVLILPVVGLLIWYFMGPKKK